MLFNSLPFLLFFPAVVILFFVVPNRFRNVWLLTCSYFYYMCWNVKYILLLMSCTFLTYISGLMIERYRNRITIKKLIVVTCLFANLGMLFFFKYCDWLLRSIASIFSHIGISLAMPAFDVILPVGISFFIFQTSGYIIDVYRGKITAEKNLTNYALFVAFFPQLVAGPIERSKNMLAQFKISPKFEYERVKRGLLLMLWGYFMKVVIADRIAILVDYVFGNVESANGVALILAIILFAFQIYCDFGGYSYIAIGAACVFGYSLMENFKQPYYSETVAEFWRNWHISLTTWFKDYLYIPLGGNRKGRLRKYINEIFVFSISGLWHGASWHFAMWGGINGLFIVLGDITYSIRERIRQFLNINDKCVSFRMLKTLTTFLLVDYAWLFFRANTIKEAIGITKKIFTGTYFYQFFDGTIYSLGLNANNFWFMIISLIILALVDMVSRRINIFSWIETQNIYFKWGVYYVLIFSIIIFGIYGASYDTKAFIYFQF